MQEVKQIKDFKVILKDMEPLVKDARFLHRGRDFSNFSLRPREAWASWLLCVVLRHLDGEEITFAEDEHGDGFIVDVKTGFWYEMEHVAAMDWPTAKPSPKGEERIVSAINKKIALGPSYAKGKYLIVFFDGAGEWRRDKVREKINGRHHFEGIVLIGLLEINETGYAYSVTRLFETFSITFKVQINPDFTDWTVDEM